MWPPYHYLIAVCLLWPWNLNDALFLFWLGSLKGQTHLSLGLIISLPDRSLTAGSWFCLLKEEDRLLSLDELPASDIKSGWDDRHLTKQQQPAAL